MITGLFIVGLSIITKPCAPLPSSEWNKIPKEIFSQINDSVTKDREIGTISKCDEHYEILFIPHIKEENYSKYYQGDCYNNHNKFNCHFYEKADLSYKGKTINLSPQINKRDAQYITNYVLSLGSGEDNYNGISELLKKCDIQVPITGLNMIANLGDNRDVVNVYLYGNGNDYKFLELSRVDCGLDYCGFVLSNKENWCHSVILH